MVQRGFGMSRCDISMALLALVDRLFQMPDRLLGMRISFGLFTRLRMGECCLGMCCKDIRIVITHPLRIGRVADSRFG